MKIVTNKCRNRKSAQLLGNGAWTQKAQSFFSSWEGPGKWGVGIFFWFFMFPMCSHQVPKTFLKFPICFTRCSQYQHTNVPYVLPKSCLLFSCIGRLGEGGSLSSNRNFYFGKSPFTFFWGDRPIKMTHWKKKNWILEAPHLIDSKMNKYARQR